MTADEKNGASAPMPAWAEGLDLNPHKVRASDHTLKRIVESATKFATGASQRLVLRRLADAEMKLAALSADRGEPDFLIDRDGEAWRRIGPGTYSVINRDGLIEEWSRERMERRWGPVTEAWKGKIANSLADRGEPDFLIESDGTRWERVGQDMYQLPGDPGFRPSREKIERSSEGPVTEAWKGQE